MAAGVVWPISSPPIVRGAILVSAAGRILEVGPDERVPRPDAARPIDVPQTAVVPGLVNAHTHLELTAFRDQLPEDDFFSWIQHVRQAKRSAESDLLADSACEGLRECWRLGVTTVADTGDTGAAAVALRRLGGRGVVYQEVFGPHPDVADAALAELTGRVERLAAEAPGTVSVGVSPHAPYTVSGRLFEYVARYASSEGLPMAVHAAESQEEVEFVTRGTGPFANSWRSRNIPLPTVSRSPVAFLERHRVLSERLLCIHAVHTDDRDRAVLRDAGAAVALCPRSNDRHGHGESPVAACVSTGLRRGLGTDSVASVSPPDMFAEVREAMRIAGLSPEEGMRLATVDAATAIGLEGEIGTIEPGKWADLCFLQLGTTTGFEDGEIMRRIAGTAPPDVQGVWIAGRCRSGGPAGIDARPPAGTGRP